MAGTEASKKANGAKAPAPVVEEAGHAEPSAQPTAEGGESAAEHKPSLTERRHDLDEIRRVFENGEYPYKRKIARKDYEKHKAELQVELLKVQDWVKESGQKIVLICSRAATRPARAARSSGLPSI
jgi:hypothetical protein